MLEPQFWLIKSLEQMNQQEWEAICDGCGKCCLHSFIDDEGNEDEFAITNELRDGETLVYTNIVCRYVDTDNCHCTRYEERQKLVPSCVQLTKDNLKDVFYMPKSCSYRRLHEGRGLPSWHPLNHQGKKTAMHKQGMSIRNKVFKDNQVDLDEFEDYIADWPEQDLD